LQLDSRSSEGNIVLIPGKKNKSKNSGIADLVAPNGNYTTIIVDNTLVWFMGEIIRLK